jgi:hypothetical protein
MSQKSFILNKENVSHELENFENTHIILVAKSWTMYYIKCSSGREALLKGKTQYSWPACTN